MNNCTYWLVRSNASNGKWNSATLRAIHLWSYHSGWMLILGLNTAIEPAIQSSLVGEFAASSHFCVIAVLLTSSVRKYFHEIWIIVPVSQSHIKLYKTEIWNRWSYQYKMYVCFIFEFMYVYDRASLSLSTVKSFMRYLPVEMTRCTC